MRAAALDRRLEAIAGPPLAALVAPAIVQVGPLDPLGDRTLYAVVRIIDRVNSYSGVATLGVTNGYMRLQESTSGNTSMSIRVDAINGSINRNPSTNNQARVPGTVAIGWVQVADGMTKCIGGWGSPTGTASEYFTPGDGMGVNATLTLHGNSPSTKNLCAVAYKRAHDLATRTRVMAWLAQRYQVMPPPAG